MSTHALRCSRCDRECVYDRCAPFGQGQHTVFAVAWRCPDGHGQSLDVCPVGPLVPARGLCLNCGESYPDDGADALCGACGLSRRQCPGSLGLTDTPAADPIAAARSAFAQGLFRHGLAIINQALQEDSAPFEAWFVECPPEPVSASFS